jgi:uncharacterized Fe-S cluster protein YjdI
MKTRWNYSNYGNDLRLTFADAKKCSHSGECTADVMEVMKKPYVRKQLATLNQDKLLSELSDYGAWDEIELSNHPENLMRWVWISAGDIVERAND